MQPVIVKDAIMSDYHPPKWIVNPEKNKWKLDEIKDGIIVHFHELTAPLVTFGRTPGVKGALAIVTAHESCSRLHARIAFDSTGTPWLRDLGSGNGTKGMLCTSCICVFISLFRCIPIIHYISSSVNLVLFI